MRKLLGKVANKGRQAKAVPNATRDDQANGTLIVVDCAKQSSRQSLRPQPREQNSADVTTFSGFDSWLSSLTPNQGPSEDTMDAPAELDGPRPTYELDPTSPSLMKYSQTIPLIVQDDIGDEGLLNILLHGVRKKDCQTMGLVRLNVSRLITITELNKLLMCNGYQPTLGLYCRATGIALKPRTLIEEPVPVRIVSGASSYDLHSGLRINVDEKFSNYQSKLHLRVQCKDSELRINDGDLKISFRRTLRVPENGQMHDLPADFGPLPLQSIAAFIPKLSKSNNASLFDMIKKGGVFFPLYQREAMYILFQCASDKSPYAVRVFVGGVNAVSGRSWKTKSSRQSALQDYVVVPPQSWLDGIAVDTTTVKQFVAMPLGSGYSVEKQITGSEDLGGVQLEIIPSGYQAKLRRVDQSGYEHSYAPNTTARDNNLPPGQDLYLCSPQLAFRKGDDKDLKERDTFVREISGRTPALDLSDPLDLVALHEFKLTIEFRPTDAKRFRVQFQCSPWSTLSENRALIGAVADHKAIPLSDFTVYTFDKFFDQDKPLVSQGIFEDTTLKAGQLECESRSSVSAPLYLPTKGIEKLSATSELGWTMSIAAGGTIRQQILRDKYHPNIWMKSAAAIVSIQILNSVAYESVTGMLAPPTPVSPETYIKSGIPFFTTYGEAVMTEGKSNFAAMKSLAELDKLGPAIPLSNSLAAGTKIACVKCRKRFCNCVYVFALLN
ncbi:hypothetical protein H2201_008713 [Coniosporium apollinis]|uniref:MACPF domain-containing protein n=1 Tax=Coniosporium apollinis TaxID=61459 RepID=A0ABQ9NG26_9PEZI|nr:hypothetical protein H2201_008713 [Coniosporium apollinis]